MSIGKQGLSSSSRKYGFPLYCVCWFPLHQENSQEDGEEDNQQSGEETSGSAPTWFIVLGGGGGGGHCGLPNIISVIQYDFFTASLSGEPIYKVETGEDLPYRMAMHPGGEGIVCSFPTSCKWFEWCVPEGSETQMPALISSEKLRNKLVIQQAALVFSPDGSMLAAGSEDHDLTVFEWPNMKSVLSSFDPKEAAKDLDFSYDGKHLALLGDKGSCWLWDLTLTKIVANVPMENGEVFRFCRFSRDTSRNILFIISVKGQSGSIVLWDFVSGKRLGSKCLIHDSISAFNISADGKMLAIGTVEGDIVVADSSRIGLLMKVKKAHLGIVTAVVFSPDSRALASISIDSSARVTFIRRKGRGATIWFVLVILFVALLAYLLKDVEILSHICPHMKQKLPAYSGAEL